MKDSTRSKLDTLYKDIGKPWALSTPRKLYEAAKSEGIKFSECISYLNAQEDYSLHKNTRLNFPRNPILVSRPRRTIVSDLADLAKLSRFNDKVKYLMVVLDGYSRLLKVFPMENKTGKLSAAKLEEALNDPDFEGVTRLFTDAGGEYINTHTKKLFKSKRVKQYSTHNSRFKTSLAEVVIKTLKGKIFRYLTYKNTKRYIDVLPKLVEAYNTSKHSRLNATPLDVHTKYNKEDIEKLFQYMYGSHKKLRRATKCSINVGDVVRVTLDSREKVFRKAYEVLNSREKFIVHRVDKSNREPIFFLKDLMGEDIKGAFYQYELIKTC